MVMMAADHLTAIKHFEAKGGQPHLVAYQCGAQKWTIGYGRKRGIGPNDTCTPQEAEMMLMEDVAEANSAIGRMFRGMTFTAGERAALVSFLINFGETKFRGYTLYELIRNHAPQLEIFEQWLKYQYTIVDADADGDLDAIIDRGLPIRRYREVLLWAGYSWEVAQAAANENNLDLREERVGWKDGGFRERLIARTPISEVLRRADQLAQFEAAEDGAELAPDDPPYLTEPDPDMFIFGPLNQEEKINMAYEEEDVPLPPEKKKAIDDAFRRAIDDPEPTTVEKVAAKTREIAAKVPSAPVSDDLNAQQVERLQNPETASTMAPSVNRGAQMYLPKTLVGVAKPAPMEDPVAKVVPVESVGYLAEVDKQPGNITAKRLEKAKRAKGFAKQTGGKELIGLAGASIAAEYVGAAEPVLQVVEKYPRETLAWVVGGILFFGVIWYAIGSWQRERGEDQAEDLMR